jgi:N-acyl-phosphatidylethanolamine-hydrolysing phospholipase D
MPPEAHDENGLLENSSPNTSVRGRWRGFLKWMLIDRPRAERQRPSHRDEFAAAHPRVAPRFPSPRAAANDLVITWVGHSAFLIQIGGRNLLTDPIWGQRASPISWLGPRRWVPPGIDFGALPPIDGVLISHNHYDHLDLPTVRRIIDHWPDARWWCPTGVGPWLTRRGARDVVERGWWQSLEWAADAKTTLTVTCTPAKHFSGRGFNDRNRTLWCGWVVRAGTRAVYFVGDTGYHPRFAEIGSRLGPFDSVLMPIGAYDPQWFMRPVHVTPEDAVTAYGELSNGSPRALMIGMHWGTFKLTNEPMDEPPERARRAWAAAGHSADRIWVPRHGETRHL